LPHSRNVVREHPMIARAFASDPQVFGGRPAAIGDFFVFDRLSFVKCRQASLLNRRNVHKNVFASRRGLDEAKALGRVEPLYSTFSHYVVSAG
jgi:hypothetical protein